jgi:hypothetical protein
LNRALLLTVSLACSTVVSASPPPPLPWVTSSFSVQLESGRIDFGMDCPDGKLTRLSAKRGDQVAEFPVQRLAEWEFVGTCSGVSTTLELESEGSSKVYGIVLNVRQSQEYVNEEVWITFDPNVFRFTQAMWLLTYPMETSQVKRMNLE